MGSYPMSAKLVTFHENNNNNQIHSEFDSSFNCFL